MSYVGGEKGEYATRFQLLECECYALLGPFTDLLARKVAYYWLLRGIFSWTEKHRSIGMSECRWSGFNKFPPIECNYQLNSKQIHGTIPKTGSRRTFPIKDGIS